MPLDDNDKLMAGELPFDPFEGAEPLLPPPTRRTRFNLGDEVELGTDLAENLQPAVFAEGDVWRPTECAWKREDEMALRLRAQRYSGLTKTNERGNEVPIRLSSGACRGIVECARARLAEPEFFAAAPRGAAFADTFVRVEDNELIYEPLTLEHRVRHPSPYRLPKNPSAPAFEQFLGELWANCSDAPERKRLIYEFAGLALVDMVTQLKKSLVLVGPKDTGKSRLLDALSALFPRDAVSHVPLQRLREPYDRAALAGKRLNVVAELPSASIRDSETAKSLVGGDPVTARHPHGRVFKLECLAAHIFAANELPLTADPALLGRLLVMNCLNVVPPHKQDRTLKARLVAEAPHIAALALRTVPETLRRGTFTEPPSAGALTAEWHRESDSVMEWAEECLEHAPNGAVPHGTLYEDYRRWMARNGYGSAESMRKWGKSLRASGFVQVRQSTYHWRVRLVASPRG